MRKQKFHQLSLMLLGLVILGLFALWHSPKTIAANPTTINFQGKVVNNSTGNVGINVSDGSYSFIFRLYDQSSPTTTGTCSGNAHCWWEETDTLTVTSGVFQVQLGAVCPFTNACNSSHSGINWNTNNALYLTMQFNSDAAGFMSPTIPLTSVPYAFNADNLGGISSSGFIQNQTASLQQANFKIQSAATGSIAGVIEGASGQSVDIFDVQTSTPTVVFGISSTGAISLSSTTTVTGSNTFTVNGGLTTLNGATAGSASALTVNPNASTNVGIIIKGIASQSADLLEFQDSTAAVINRVDANGDIESGGYINDPSGGIGNYGNLLVRSENFGTTWVASAALTETNDDAGSNPSPNGTTSADKLADTSNGGNIAQTSNTAPTNANYTFSVWLKTNSGTATSLLRIDGATTGTGTGANCNVTTTWQRCSVTQNPNGFTGNLKVLIFPGGTGGTATVAAWGAQLVLGSYPGVYSRTTVNAVTQRSSGLTTNGDVIFGPNDSTTSFQVQRSGGVAALNLDTIGNLLSLGVASSQTYSIQLFNASGSGSISLTPANPGSNPFTITLPAETGTACTTAATGVCNTAGGLSNVAYLNQNQTFTANNTFRASSNSSTAFQVQDSSSDNYIQADTLGANLYLGNPGIASNIQIGNTTGAVAQTINIGNNSTNLSTTALVLGSNTSASTTLIQGGIGNAAINVLADSGGTITIGGNTAGGTAQTPSITERYVHSFASPAGSPLTFSPTTTINSGKLAVMFVGVGAGNTVTAVSDSTGNNTWHLDKIVSNGTQTVNIISSQINSQITSSGTITLTFSSTNNTNNQIWIEELSNMATANAFDQSANDTNTGTTATTPATGTLSQASEVAFQLVRTSSSGITFTPGGSWITTSGTGTITGPSSSGVSAIAYQVTSATTGISGNVGMSASNTWQMVVATYKVATAAAATNLNVNSQSLFAPVSDSTAAFKVQNAANSKSVFDVDTTNGQIILGASNASGVNGTIVFDNSSGSGTSTITLAGNPTTSYTYQLPTGTVNSNQCLQSGTVSSGNVPLTFGSCGGVVTLQNAYDSSSSPATITTSSASKNIVFVSGTGFNSTGAFQVQNANADPELNVDTTSINALVSNPSFENNSTSGWVASGTGASIAATTAQKYIGNYSLDFTTGTAIGNSARLTVGTGLSTSTTYTLSFEARTDTAMSGTLSASYSPTGTAANETDCAVLNPSRTVLLTGWTKYYCTIDTSSTSPNASGYIAIKQNDTTSRNLYIDAVQIEAGSAITKGQIGITGFESGTTGWAPKGTSVTAVQSSADHYNGSDDLLITDTTSPATNQGATYTTNSTGTTELNLSTVYTLSFWAKASAGSNFSTIEAGYARDGSTQINCFLNSTSVVTTGWNYYSCPITTDGITPASTAYIYIEHSDSGAHAWMIDDVQLTQTSTIITDDVYKEAGLALNGVINSPIVIKNQADAINSLQLQNSSGTTLLLADTLNSRINIGTLGTETGQFYVSGSLPVDISGGGVSTGASTSPIDFSVVGRYAYLADSGNSKIQVFDVSNPAIPVDVSGGGVTAGTNDPLGISVQGHYAYVIDGTPDKFQVIDVSKPSAPADLTSGGVSTAAAPNQLAVQGKYAFIGENGNLLQIFDISNSAKPQDVTNGGFNTSSGIQNMFVQGRYVYLTKTTSKFQIIDVSNPASPVDVTSGGVSLATVPTNSAIYVQGRYAYIGEGTPGRLQIFDISNPASPTDVTSGGINFGFNPASIFVQDRYAYVIDASLNKLYVFDVSTPASPLDITNGGVATNNTGPISLLVGGRYAYVIYGGSTNKIQVFDLGGSYQQQLEAGGGEFGTINVSGNTQLAGDLNIQGGTNIGQSLAIGGNLGANGQVLFANQTNSTTAFQIQNSSDLNIVSVDTTNSNTNNLVANPSFESTISNWSAVGSGTASQSSAQAYEGSKSLLIATGATEGGASYSTGATTFLATNTTYTLSAFLKTDSNVPIHIDMGDEEATGTLIPCLSNQLLPENGGWQRFTCTWTTSGTTPTNSFIYFKQNTGDPAVTKNIYVDDILLQTDSNTQTIYRNGAISLSGAMIASPVILQNNVNSSNALQVNNASGVQIFNVDTTDTNLISNPGFEINSTGWSAQGTNTTIRRDTTQFYSGLAALKVTQVTSTTADSGAQFSLNPIVTAASTTYTASFYGKLDGSSAAFTDVMIEYSADGTQTAGHFSDCGAGSINTQTMVSGGWTRFVCQVSSTTTPSTSGYLRIMSTGTTLHTYYIDGVQLEVGSSASAYGAGALSLNGQITNPVVFVAKSNSVSAFQVQNSSSLSFLTIDTLNNVIQIGSSTAGTNGIVLSLNNYTNGTTEPTELDGAMYYNSNFNQFRCGTKGAWVTCGGLSISNTSSVSCTNTTSATACNPNNFFTGSAPNIPANYCLNGRVIHVHATGIYSGQTAASTLTFSVRLASTIIGAAGTAATGTVANMQWSVDFYITCDSTTTVTGEGTAYVWATAAGNANTGQMTGTGTTTVTNTGGQSISLFVNVGATADFSSITLEQFIVQGI